MKTGNPCPSSHLYAAHTHTTHMSHKVLPAPPKNSECPGNAVNISSVFVSLPPMCRWACASGRPAVPPPLSSQSSGPAAPRRCCWGPGRPSPASPWASCCSAGRTPTPPGTPRTAGRAPPGTRTSPCRWGWAGRGTRSSCTWTSPSPWSLAWSASHRCLRGGGGKAARECHQVVRHEYCEKC